MSAAKPPVVMIHGAFCGSWVFEGWARCFRDAGYTVLTPDLRHHGAAADHAALGRLGILDYAEDLGQLIDGLGDLPVIIGHSMGGLLAQMLAARGKARALVLLAPAASWGVWPSSLFELAGAQALFLAGDFWHRPIRPDRWLASCGLDSLDPEQRARALSRLVPESGLAMFEILHWPFDLSRASLVDARQVVCPIMCVAGGKDPITPSGTVRRIARRYRGRAQYRELRDASHWLLLEHGWEKLVSQTLFWLSRLHDDADAPQPDGRTT